MKRFLVIALLVCFGGIKVYSQDPPKPLIYETSCQPKIYLGWIRNK